MGHNIHTHTQAVTVAGGGGRANTPPPHTHTQSKWGYRGVGRIRPNFHPGDTEGRGVYGPTNHPEDWY